MKHNYILHLLSAFILFGSSIQIASSQNAVSENSAQHSNEIPTIVAGATSCPASIDLGPDRYICNQPSAMVSLWAITQGQIKQFYWEGFPSGIKNILATIKETTTFKFVAWGLDSSINLIQNPQFEDGNTAFETKLIHSPGDLLPFDVYDVTNKLQPLNPLYPNCGDHTTGSGLMLATGPLKFPTMMWRQTVPVQAGELYFFSGYTAELLAKGFLRVSINGDVIIPTLFPPLLGPNCNWRYFSAIWESGSASSAQIVIEAVPFGMLTPAFVLDDLFFGPLCRVEDEITVHLTNVQAVAAPAPSQHYCEGYEIALNGIGSSEGPSFTYQWNTPDGNIVSGENTLNPIVNAPGTYTLTVTLDDPNYPATCTATATTTVVEAPNQLSALITSPQGLNCLTKQITLFGDATPIAGNRTYQWTASNGGNIQNSAESKNVQINAPGTYTLLVTDLTTGCTAVAERDIEADTIPPVVTANGNPITCLQPESVLSGIGSSSGLGIYYNWTTPNGNITAGQDSIVAVADTAGTYILKVTNAANFCTETDTVVVSINNTQPEISIAPAEPISCLVPLVGLSAAEDTNNVHLVYTWLTTEGNIVSGENSPAPIVNAPGWYVLELRDTLSGCIAADSIQVEADDNAIIAIANAPEALNCTRSSVILNTDGSTQDPALTYLWTTTDGNIVGGADTPTPTVDQPGTYQLWLLNPDNGCTATDIALVTLEDAPPPVSIAETTPLTCIVTKMTIVGQNAAPAGSFTYEWTAANGGNITAGENTLEPEINAPGTYTLRATNLATGCTAIVSADVAQDVSTPEIGIEQPASLTCAATTLVLQGQNAAGGGNFAYYWTASNSGNITAGENTLQPEVNAPGTYTLLATNAVNGCTATAETTVIADEVAPETALTVSGILNCHLTPVTLTSTSNVDSALLEHIWTTPDGTITNTGTDPVLPVDQPGTYLLTLTNTQNGCTTTAEATAVQNEVVAADLTHQADATCFGATDGTATVLATGGNGQYTYAWENGEQTATAEHLPAGIHAVTVTDGQGCTTVIVAQIGQPNAVAPNVTSTAPTFLGGSDGTASANPDGGTPGYVYVWSTGQTTQTILDLPAGTYTVTVIDANGCTAEQTVTVFGGACDVDATATGSDPACHGTPTGTATAQPLGGTAPFTFLWSNGATAQTVTGLEAEAYSVVVTDANGCTVAATVVLDEPPLLTLQPGDVTDASCPDTPDGSATVLPGGGTGDITVTWNDGQQGPTATGLLAGTHTATATDQNGCTTVLSLIVNAMDTEPPVIQGGPVTLPLGPAGVISLTLQNLAVTATDNCAVEVDFFPGSFDCLQLGTHPVTIAAYDAAGNSSSLIIQVTVIDDMPPSVKCPADVRRCADQRTVQYLAPVATDNCLMLGGHFDLVEGLPSGSQFPVGTTLTTYTFTDASGNVGSCSFAVVILTPIAVALNGIQHDVGGQGVGGVQVSVGGSQPGYVFEWKRADGQTVATTEDLVGVSAGAYTLLVTDSEGCTTVAGPFVVDNLVGTHIPDWADLVAIYPNPTKGAVTVVLPDAAVGPDVRFAVFDATGRLVLKQNAAGLKQAALDWSGLADGTYALLIRTNTGQAAYRIVLRK
jgi:hypothetical protein